MHVTRRSAVLSLGAGLLSSRFPRFRSPRGDAPPQRTDGDAFWRAVDSGDAGEVRRLLQDDPARATATDAAGRSAFVRAVLAGRPQVAGALRAHGLALDIVEAVLAEDGPRFDELAAQDPGACARAHPIGGTPLYAGALVGSSSLSRLRGAGCAPDAAPPGGTGFTPARGAMDARTVSQAWIAATDLLGNGADPNAPQRGGDSVLHGAVRRRSARLVRLAVRKHAAVDARDAQGRTPAALAAELGWDEGAALVAAHADLPRDHRASRLALDANREPVAVPDLSDVPPKTRSAVTGPSHNDLARVRALVAPDPRLVFARSADDELPIEAAAHTGNRPIMRFLLEHGAPLSLPTAVSLGDHETVRFLLARDPRLVHERGAHDFPVMWYAALGGGSVEMAALLQQHGVDVDQESMGITALHWCVVRGDAELAAWLLENGAAVDPIGHKWSSDGQTPLELAQARGEKRMEELLRAARRGG